MNASSTLWSKIQPVFQVRDDLAKWIASIGTLTWFGEKTAAILGRVSDAVDKMLFAALGNFIKPVLWSVRKQIEEERAALLEKEKNANQDPECDIFSHKSTATNPTHSQIAKDHFDCILNIPANI